MYITKDYSISVEDINASCPSDMQPYIDAYNYGMVERDREAWSNNRYTMYATVVAVDSVMNGKKAKAKYPDKPFLEDALEDYGLTQEEIDERELRKMIAAEDAWQSVYRSKGLPETKIK